MKNLMKSKNTYLISLSKLFVLIFLLSLYSCVEKQAKSSKDQLSIVVENDFKNKKIITGSNRTEEYLYLLKNKTVAIVANHTSVIFKNNGYKHLVDSLLSRDINIVKVFSPEHGFRGNILGGEHFNDHIDKETGIQIKSIYGETRKPSKESLKDVDVVIFDIQDVGVRFYTYISTMTYVMEACAENNIPVIILDRPNPNGHFIDGPMLEFEYKSFVGMHPVPLVYGMTIGEYALMVNSEKWLSHGIQCDLTIIELKNYNHQTSYSLPIKPSPNLPNDRSINLYPSLGLFEGTIINEGRGTDFQFQRYGAPFFPVTDFNYTPESNIAYKNPKFNGQLCYGVDLSRIDKLDKVDLSFLIDAYKKTPKNLNFFNKSFTILAGNTNLRKQIESNLSAQEIETTWKKNIENFKKIRNKYLIYP